MNTLTLAVHKLALVAYIAGVLTGVDAILLWYIFIGFP